MTERKQQSKELEELGVRFLREISGVWFAETSASIHFDTFSIKFGPFRATPHGTLDVLNFEQFKRLLAGESLTAIVSPIRIHSPETPSSEQQHTLF